MVWRCVMSFSVAGLVQCGVVSRGGVECSPLVSEKCCVHLLCTRVELVSHVRVVYVPSGTRCSAKRCAVVSRCVLCAGAVLSGGAVAEGSLRCPVALAPAPFSLAPILPAPSSPIPPSAASSCLAPSISALSATIDDWEEAAPGDASAGGFLCLAAVATPAVGRREVAAEAAANVSGTRTGLSCNADLCAGVRACQGM